MARLGFTAQTSIAFAAAPELPPYTRASDLLADLSTLRLSLVQNHGQRLAELLVDPILLEVRTYGLHLQTLDIRQHARVHKAALEEFASIQAGNRLTLPPPLTDQTAEVLATFRAIADLKRAFPPEVIRLYVISGAASARDCLNVLVLARLGGVTVEATPRDGDS